MEKTKEKNIYIQKLIIFITAVFFDEMDMHLYYNHYNNLQDDYIFMELAGSQDLELLRFRLKVLSFLAKFKGVKLS